jgi:hypothetical protein
MMKIQKAMNSLRISLLSIFMLTVVSSMAQNLTRAEYFFNTDPGVGKATAISISPGTQLNCELNISTHGLAPGFHHLFIRLANADGTWGVAEGRTIWIQPQQSDQNIQLSAAEYFFDSDPGVGKGISIPGPVSGEKWSNEVQISLTGISPGFHHLYVRFRNNMGQWGIAEGRTIYVQQQNEQPAAVKITHGEYFFNTDPGVGKGNSLPVDAAASQKITHNIDLAGLTPGFHHLYVRYRNSERIWGLTEGRTLYIQTLPDNEATADITHAEYFFNQDPGQGKGKSLEMVKANKMLVTENFSSEGLTPGIHQFFIRFKNEKNVWGLAEGRTIYIPEPQEIPQTPLLVEGEYFFNEDPGIGKGRNFEFESTEKLEMTAEFPVENLPAGEHTLSIRIKNSDGYWSYTHAKPFTTCRNAEIVDFPVTLPDVCEGEDEYKIDFSDVQVHYAERTEWIITPGDAGTMKDNQFGLNPDYSGEVTITLNATPYGNCNIMSSFVSFQVIPKPVIDFPASLPDLCKGDNTIDFSDVKVQNAVGMVWVITPDAAGKMTDNKLRLNADYTGDVMVTLNVEALTPCHSASAHVSFKILSLPVISFSGETSFCNGETTEITASGGILYEWNNGHKTATLVVSASGIYKVVVKDENGCAAEKEIQISNIPAKAETIAVTHITPFSADVEGLITSECDNIVTRGLVLDLTSDFSGSPIYVKEGSGTGSYTATVNDLSPSTTYFIRAYATDGKHQVYGDIKQFTTLKDKYVIKSTSGSNGTIDPIGDIEVEYGQSKTFNIIPASGYIIAEVKVNGASVGKITTYSFEKVDKDHSIHAEFQSNTSTINLLARSIRVYPNPAEDVIYIEAGSLAGYIPSIKYTVYDIYGRLIFGNNLYEEKSEVSIASLQTGIYFIRFYNQHELLHVVKLVKAR